jgi:hypothetical protein
LLTEWGFYIASQIFIQILKDVNYYHTKEMRYIFKVLNLWNIGMKIRDSVITKFAEFSFECIEDYTTNLNSVDKRFLYYFAPEVENCDECDIRADIYSLGLILQQLFFIDIKRLFKIINYYIFIF